MSVPAAVTAILNQTAAQPLQLVADPTTSLEAGVAANDAEQIAQSVVLQTSRGEIEFSVNPDGSIVLWSPSLVLTLPAPESERLTAMLKRNNAIPCNSTPAAPAQALAPVPVAPAVTVAPTSRDAAPSPVAAAAALSCVALLTPSTSTKRVSQHIRLEGAGWGVNVAAGLRYIYQSRDLARVARVNHPVGRFGRVA